MNEFIASLTGGVVDRGVTTHPILSLLGFGALCTASVVAGSSFGKGTLNPLRDKALTKVHLSVNAGARKSLDSDLTNAGTTVASSGSVNSSEEAA